MDKPVVHGQPASSLVQSFMKIIGNIVSSESISTSRHLKLWLKYVAKRFIRALPAKQAMLRIAAKLPPALRSAISLRFWWLLSSNLPESISLRTNFGFSKRYFLFSSENPRAAFGKPELYNGERGALELARLMGGFCKGFVDVGANFGFFSFYIREYLDSPYPIYLFEPDPELFKLVTDNVAYASLAHVTCRCAAIGEIDGMLTFYKNPDHREMGSITTHFTEIHQTTPITVECVRFDTFVRQHQLQHLCVRVDVENAEAEFIEGARGEMDAISCLIMEVLGPAHEKQVVQQLIREFGFHAYYINDYQLEYVRVGSYEYKFVDPQVNWLFCKDAPSVLGMKLAKSKFTIVDRVADNSRGNS